MGRLVRVSKDAQERARAEDEAAAERQRALGASELEAAAVAKSSPERKPKLRLEIDGIADRVVKDYMKKRGLKGVGLGERPAFSAEDMRAIQRAMAARAAKAGPSAIELARESVRAKMKRSMR